MAETHSAGRRDGDPGPRLLLVEDDSSTRHLIATNLTAHRYRVTEAESVDAAFRAWESQRPDLVLLDLGLPDLDGTAVIRRIRREASTPILVLSARQAEATKVAALEAGADDYVTKPFGMDELRARVAALLRRASGPASDATGRIAAGPVVVDVGRRSVMVSGSAVDLTPHEYELLRVLLSMPGRVVTKGRLLRAVWGSAYTDESHYLHVYVSRLRRKLDAADPGARAGRLIAVEPGVGYRVTLPDDG
jgi:two-component system, OmpR family, KDP operon response regulator KdpE